MTVAALGNQSLTSECIQKGLLNHSWPVVSPNGRSYQPACVLLPLLVSNGQWHLLYIRRSETVQNHKGQVAFPGGAVEATDMTLADTALRETEEEVGIPAADVTVIGQMGQMLTITNYLVTPIVGIIRWPSTLVLEKNEVVRAFTIPLAWLADPRNHEVREVDLRGHLMPVKIFKPYDGEKLWGITAQITLDFIELIKTCAF